MKRYGGANKLRKKCRLRQCRIILKVYANEIVQSVKLSHHLKQDQIQQTKDRGFSTDTLMKNGIDCRCLKNFDHGWQFGIVITSFGTSTKLLLCSAQLSPKSITLAGPRPARDLLASRSQTCVLVSFVQSPSC